MDRYIQVVAVCNNLALLVSQTTSSELFIQRISLLKSLQQYWTKGFRVVVTISSDEREGYEVQVDDEAIEDIKPSLSDITTRYRIVKF